MEKEDLFALSPLDGRYIAATKPLRDYFSEFALMKYRVTIEVLYMMCLPEWKITRPLRMKEKLLLRSCFEKFSVDDALRIKKFESETKHDVKALEYFLKEKLLDTPLADLLPFVHFGLTSEDTNNLAFALMISDAHREIIVPEIDILLAELSRLASQYADCLMLGRTHGQPAVPTTFGKELAVFYSRLIKHTRTIKQFRFEGKLNGAVGNYNGLAFVFPNTDWIKFSRRFISSLGLEPNLITTQILPYDNLIGYTQELLRINNVLLGLCQDMWQYIGRGLVVLARDPKQVGSSTMPHKINPIDFENAEGNFQVAQTYFDLYSRKLSLSRLQRDLSDSTVKRTVGSALGHTLISWKSIQKGLGKIAFNKEEALGELNSHWEILAEAIQMYVKVKGDEKGYEKVKALTMGKQLDMQSFKKILKQFPPLAKLTPASYSGLAKRLTSLALKEL